jgi:hypothetical protein
LPLLDTPDPPPMPRHRTRLLLAIALTLIPSAALAALPRTAASGPGGDAALTPPQAESSLEALLCLLDDVIGSGVRRPGDSVTAPAAPAATMRLLGVANDAAVRARLMLLRSQLLALVASGQVDAAQAAPVFARIDAALAATRY